METEKKELLPDLPEDVILQIFCGLPQKSIGRFRMLSKRHCSLLTGHNFTRKHLQCTTDDESNTGFLLVKRNSTSRVDSIIRLPISTMCNNNSPQVEHWSFGEYVICRYSCKIWGCFDGLVFIENGLLPLSSPKERYLELWNPTTKKSYSLPESPPARFNTYRYSFGYDYGSNDYKILKVILSDTLVRAYIYSCRNRSWKEIENFPLNFRYKFCRSQFVGGKIYWIVSDVDNGISGIVSLDLATERFEAVPQPDCHPLGGSKDGNIEYYRGIYLTVLDGKLCVYWNNDGKFNMFMMQDEGGRKFWNALYTIDYKDIFEDGKEVVLRLLYVRNDGQLYMQAKLWKSPYLYGYRTKGTEVYHINPKKRKVISKMVHVEYRNINKHACAKSLVVPIN